MVIPHRRRVGVGGASQPHSDNQPVVSIVPFWKVLLRLPATSFPVMLSLVR